MKRSLVFAGAAALALSLMTPLSMAQPTDQPQTPPQAQTETTPATPASPATPADPAGSSAAPASPASPAAPAAPATPAASSAAAENTSVAPQGCRTRKEAGEPCACLSDPSRVGTSTAHPAGHNVCVRSE